MKKKSKKETAIKKSSKNKFENVKFWQVFSVMVIIVIIYLLFIPYTTESDVNETSQEGTSQPQVTPLQITLPPDIPQTVVIEIAEDPMLGDPDAPITVIEFGDFQCPYCGAAMGTYQDLMDQFKAKDPKWEPAVPKLKRLAEMGVIRFIYLDFPLSFHPEAQSAAEAAECAHEQDKFWEYHDLLYANQGSLGNDLYLFLANYLELDTIQFQECFDSGKYRQEVLNDMDHGKAAGVQGTPTFFVNGIMIVGAQPYSVFELVIGAELDRLKNQDV